MSMTPPHAFSRTTAQVGNDPFPLTEDSEKGFGDSRSPFLLKTTRPQEITVRYLRPPSFSAPRLRKGQFTYLSFRSVAIIFVRCIILKPSSAISFRSVASSSKSDATGERWFLSLHREWKDERSDSEAEQKLAGMCFGRQADQKTEGLPSDGNPAERKGSCSALKSIERSEKEDEDEINMRCGLRRLQLRKGSRL